MKIIGCTASNFGSYSNLEFTFEDQGLTLISGPTGAGKSTIFDVVPWVLFGRTAKGGSVDEVVSWNSEAPTEGRLEIELTPGNYISITRIRTRKSQDLYYETDSSDRKRGKDIQDTQNIINGIIGIDCDVYLAGAYFHEFSQTAQFFTTTAKVRRQITEQIVDLTLCKNLSDNMSEYKKMLKKEQEALANQIEAKEYKINYVSVSIKSELVKSKEWANKTAKKMSDLVSARDNYKTQQSKAYEKSLAGYYEKQFELESQIQAAKEEIIAEDVINSRKAALNEHKASHKPDICGSCGRQKSRDKEMLILKEEQDIKQVLAINEQKKVYLSFLVKNLDKLQEPAKPKDQENPYVMQISELEKETNPYESNSKQLKEDLDILSAELQGDNKDLKGLKTEQVDIETLLDVADNFRSLLINNTIRTVESSTNSILNDYFHGEFRVEFNIEAADKLEVDIFKDGHNCVYTQLSKGQRQILKIAFGVAIMKAVSNHSGVRFNCIMLDEIADGCDDDIRTKAFSLLESLALEYSSVFVIEHSEAVKPLFNNRFDIKLINGTSTVEKS